MNNLNKILMGAILGFALTPMSAWAISAAAKYELNNRMGAVAYKYSLGTLLDTAAPTTLTVTGASVLSGSVTGDGGDNIVGFLRPLVAATSTTVTAAQCGSIFVGASDGNNTLVLPEASTVPGCSYTFVCGGTDDIAVDPADGTDTFASFINYTAGPAIALIAPAAGATITCVSAGSSVRVTAATADMWLVESTAGIWTTP